MSDDWVLICDVELMILVIFLVYVVPHTAHYGKTIYY